jgi:hypothetical protein
MAALYQFPNVPSTGRALLIVLVPWCLETDCWLRHIAAHAARWQASIDVVPICVERGTFSDDQKKWLAAILESTERHGNVVFATWLPSSMAEPMNYLPLIAWAHSFQARNIAVVFGVQPGLPIFETLVANIDVLGTLSSEEVIRTSTFVETLALAHRRLIRH